MDTHPEQNQSAGSPEQKLPAGGRTAPMAEGPSNADRVSGPLREVSNARGGDSGSAPDKLGGLAHFATTAIGSSPAGTTASAPVDAPAPPVRTAEQLLQNLTREVAQFKRYNAESMAVVLKPDAGTEIFLHVVNRNGQIDIQARFERGDYPALNGQWSQLQQSLSQQGVRLGGLQEGFQSFQNHSQPGSNAWGHGQMGQPQQRHQPDDSGPEDRAEAFENLLRVGSRKESVKRKSVAPGTSRRSTLEVWA